MIPPFSAHLRLSPALDINCELTRSSGMYHGNLGQNRLCNLLGVLYRHNIFFCLEYVMMSLSIVYSTLLYCWMFFGPVHFAQGLEFQYHATLGCFDITYIRSKYLISKLAKEIQYHYCHVTWKSSLDSTVEEQSLR